MFPGSLGTRPLKLLAVRCRKISNDFPVPRNSVSLKKINPITDGFSHLSSCSNSILLVEIDSFRHFRLSTIQYSNLLNWILLVLYPINSQFDRTCCVHQALSNGGIPHDSTLRSSAPTIHLSVLCNLESRAVKTNSHFQQIKQVL